MRDPDTVREFEDKYVLVDGWIETGCVDIAFSYGYKKAISNNELCALYPDCIKYDFKHYFPKDRVKKLTDELSHRLNMGLDEIKNDLKFSAIIIWAGFSNLDLML